MSSSIWTRCEGERHRRRLRGHAWRVVESQYVNSTRKLVDSDEEQEVLERLIETGKPPFPSDAPSDLHYLLATPFRYPPLRHGSRFGRRTERGIWYGARRRATALAEFAYYRFVFLAGTEASLTPLYLPVSPFRVGLATNRGIDLTRDPFDRYRAQISSATSYRVSQALGAAMRSDRIEAFLWTSARDPQGGANIGVLSPHAFSDRRPEPPESWRCVVTEEAVELSKLDVFHDHRLRFEREAFLIEGRLPVPAA